MAQNSDKSPSSQESIEEVDGAFKGFDPHAGGKISASELRGAARALGSDVSQEELGEMMAEMDSDPDGLVDLEELAEFHRSDSRAEAELREAFDMYDLDKDGSISAKELHRVLKILGDKCSLGDCTRMIKSVDSDGDGTVGFEEFKKMIIGGGGGGGNGSEKEGSKPESSI